MKLLSKFPNGIFSAKYNFIKKFVDFALNDKAKWSKSQKRKVESYYREIRRLTGRPTMIWVPNFKQRKGESAKAFEARKIENLHKIQEYSQHNMRWPKIKVAFVPLPYEGAKIRISKDGQIVVKARNFDVAEIPFYIDSKKKMKEFLENPESFIQSKVPDPKKFYSVKFGKSEIGNPQLGRFVGKYASMKLNAYAEKGAYKFGVLNPRIFQKNMKRLASLVLGLSEYTFKNQKTANAYARAKQEYRKKHAKVKPLRKFFYNKRKDK